MKSISKTFVRLLIISLTIVSILVLSSSHSRSGVDIPQNAFTRSGKICIKSHDGCNSCSLSLYQGQLYQACTEKACSPKPTQAQSKKCIQEVPEDYFIIPKINGKSYPKCSSLVFQDKTCELLYQSDQRQERGFSWKCKPNQLITSLSKPLCIADFAGKSINQKQLMRLEEAEKTKKKAIRKKKEDAKRVCLEWEDTCRKGRNFVFPPQTRLNLPVAEFNTGRKQCKENHPDFQEHKTCTSEIRHGDIPRISYDNTQSWFSRQPMILEENCVRYDNECRAYYLVLHRNRLTKELTWQWQSRIKSCAISDYRQKVKETMRCTSFYKPTVQ